MCLPLAAVALLLVAPPAVAEPPSGIRLWTDPDQYLAEVGTAFIARCDKPHIKKHTGSWPYQADGVILRVLKGAVKEESQTGMASHRPLVAGKRYMLLVLHRGAFGLDMFNVPELGSVEIPDDFDLKTLDGKPMPDQVKAVWAARRADLDRLIRTLQAERDMVGWKK